MRNISDFRLWPQSLGGVNGCAWGVPVWDVPDGCPLHFPALREINTPPDTTFQYYRSSMGADFQLHCTFIFSVNIYKAQYLYSVVQGEEY